MYNGVYLFDGIRQAVILKAGSKIRVRFGATKPIQNRVCHESFNLHIQKKNDSVLPFPLRVLVCLFCIQR